MFLIRPSSQNSRRIQAFAIEEVLVAVVIVGMMFTSFYAAISSGFAAIALSRENLRATQILGQKMEEVRTFSWTDITTNVASIPTNFLAYFFPTNLPGSSTIDAANSGIIYTGVVTIALPALTETYSNDLRLVNVQLTWKSGAVVRTRSMETYVSQYGIHNYIY